MIEEDPEDREATLRMLGAARAQFEDVRDALAATTERLRAENQTDDTTLQKQLTNLQKSIQNVIEIETKLAVRHRDYQGGAGSFVLDLDAARQEVFDRLVKQIAARGSA